MRRLTRRKLIRLLGVGGAGAALLPSFRSISASAQAGPALKRLIIFVNTSGVNLDRLRPTGADASFELSPSLASFAPFKSKMLFLDGVDQATTYDDAYNPAGSEHHTMAFQHLLTGARISSPGGVRNSNYVSVDQHIARALGLGGRPTTLQLGVLFDESQEFLQTISSDGSGTPLKAMDDPKQLFDLLYSRVQDNKAAQKSPVRAMRKRILDQARSEIGRVRDKLGREDQLVFDGHLQSITDVQAGLTRVVTECGLAEPDATYQRLMDYYPQLAKQQVELLAQSVVCGLTRVATFLFSKEKSDHVYVHLNARDGFHESTHPQNPWKTYGVPEGDYNAYGEARSAFLTKLDTWFADQVAYFCQLLDRVPEGSGTVLDNTAVVWMNTMSHGGEHSRRMIPIVTIGSCGGAFRTGRYLTYGTRQQPKDQYGNTMLHADHGGPPHNNFLVSLCNAMGVPATTFGEPAFCTGPLTGLT